MYKTHAQTCNQTMLPIADYLTRTRHSDSSHSVHRLVWSHSFSLRLRTLNSILIRGVLDWSLAHLAHAEGYFTGSPVMTEVYLVNDAVTARLCRAMTVLHRFTSIVCVCVYCISTPFSNAGVF